MSFRFYNNPLRCLYWDEDRGVEAQLWLGCSSAAFSNKWGAMLHLSKACMALIWLLSHRS